MNKEVLKMISDAASESNISLNLSKVTGDETLAQLNLDSLNSIAFDDDSQVIELTVLKRYTEESERVEFLLEEIK